MSCGSKTPKIQVFKRSKKDPEDPGSSVVGFLVIFDVLADKLSTVHSLVLIEIFGFQIHTTGFLIDPVVNLMMFCLFQLN